MSKKYKGWELMKAIADGEIKNKSRFKAGYRTFIARDGYLFTECSDRQEYATTFELAWDFELIEDEKDVEKIYCTNNNQGMITNSSDDNEKEKELRKYIVNNCKDIDEILQAVKQIDKRVKKLERD